MSQSSETRTVAIVGGGISGLAAAYSLQEKAREARHDIRFTLLESAPELGGKIVTEHVDGFTIEGGPDSFLSQKPWAMQVSRSLNLEPELIGSNPDQRKVYVIKHGRMVPMPDGMAFIVPTRLEPILASHLLSWPGKIRMGLDLFIPPDPGEEDESVGQFIRRRMGQEFLDRIAGPLMGGIHVSDPEKQSLLSTFPRFRDVEKKYGSLIKGMAAQARSARSKKLEQDSSGQRVPDSAFMTFRGGMSTLVRALEKCLEPGSVRTACTVTQVQPLAHGGFELTTAEGEAISADAVILATPATISSHLVAGFSPQLAGILGSISYVSTATVSLAYDLRDLNHPIEGSGFIVPNQEKHSISACTWSSNKFSGRAPQGTILLRCFLGGPGHEDDVTCSDAEILQTVKAELARLMDIHSEPVLSRIYRWTKGNPQYDVGHLQQVSQIQALCAANPGLFLTGSAYEGVGIPDCIHQGQQAADKAFAYLLPEKLTIKEQRQGV